jgi:NADH-quinone oxidoreductase subunit N
MFSLSGIPGTIGFIGKFQLIHALVDGSYTWLAIVLVIGSMISLGYYLRVIATIWMRAESPSPGPGLLGRLAPFSLPAMGGGSPEANEPGGSPVTTTGGSVARGSALSLPSAEVAFVAIVFAAATVGFGVFPSIVFHLADHAGRAFTGLF